MSLLAAVHAFLARECGADVADEAVVEYVAETVRAGDLADAWQDLDELLAGLSPDVWAGRSEDQRENLLLQLWNSAHGDESSESQLDEATHRAGMVSQPAAISQQTSGEAVPHTDWSAQLQQTHQAAGVQPSGSNLSVSAAQPCSKARQQVLHLLQRCPSCSTHSASAPQDAAASRAGPDPADARGHPASARGGVAAAKGERDDAGNLELLAALCPPDTGRDFLFHLLRDLHAGDMQGAAAWLLDGELRTDGGSSVEAAEEAWREAAAADERAEAERQAELRAVKQQLCDKYHLEAVAKPAAGSGRTNSATSMWSPAGDPAATKVRYRDGVPVTTKGDKYVTQTLKEEWDGGSRGKVKTKGKRGVGFS